MRSTRANVKNVISILKDGNGAEGNAWMKKAICQIVTPYQEHGPGVSRTARQLFPVQTFRMYQNCVLHGKTPGHSLRIAGLEVNPENNIKPIYSVDPMKIPFQQKNKK